MAITEANKPLYTFSHPMEGAVFLSLREMSNVIKESSPRLCQLTFLMPSAQELKNPNFYLVTDKR